MRGSFLFLDDGSPLAVLPSDIRLLSTTDSLADDELGLDVVGVAGGCGNEPILMVLRTLFVEGMAVAFPNAEPDRTVGTSGFDTVG
jgi:hypothetical protein